MNKIIPIVLLFGGLTIFSGLIGKVITTPTSTTTAMAAAPIIEANHKSAQLISVDLNKSQPARTETKTKFDLNNVNGISLNDNVEIVIKKLGQPISIEKDPYTPEIIVYAYKEMNIGFSDGFVSYVEVPAAAAAVGIDGISLRMDPESLKTALGEPDFVAEDGIVFQRNVFIIKLFTDMETHEVTSLHYYHHSNT